MMKLGDIGRGIKQFFGGKSAPPDALEGKAGNSGEFQPSGYCPPGNTRGEWFTDSGGFNGGIGTVWLDAEEPFEEYDDEMLQLAYTWNVIVYACCRMIANSFAKPPMELGRFTSKKEWRPRDDHYILNLMNRPNPYYTQAMFERMRITRKLLTGASFIWKWRNAAGEVTELWTLPTHWVTIEACGNEIVGFSMFKDQENELFVPAADMIYDRYPHVMDQFGYMGPLQACLREVQIDKERGDYLMKMIKNLVRPGMIITQNAHDGIQRQGLTASQAEDMREKLKSEGTGGIPIFPPGMEPKFPGAIQDLNWNSTEGMLAARICSAFGVDPILIGSVVGMSSGTYSDYPQARRAFYEETLLPMWDDDAEMWTYELLRKEAVSLPPRSNQWKFKYDLSDIDELQEPAMERMRRWMQAVTTGVVTVNEGRQKIGLDRVIDGDVYLRLSNIIPEPVGSRPTDPDKFELSMEPTPIPKPVETEEADNGGTDSGGE